MGTETESRDEAGSGSIPNKSSAAKEGITPKLDAQQELGDKGREARSTSDRPRLLRRLRVATIMVAILAVVGMGTAAALVSNLDEQRQHIVSGIQRLMSTSASLDAISPDGPPNNIAEVIETVAGGLFVKIDHVRVATARSIGELGTGVDRLSGTLERNQRELIAKLDSLQERLARVENHAAGASPTKPAQPIEKPDPEKPAPMPSPPAATASAAGAVRSKASAVQRIEGWAVRDVVDGMAILAGPNGLIGVFSGDVVPGLGRVDSISRRDGRWRVATTKGVIISRGAASSGD